MPSRFVHSCSHYACGDVSQRYVSLRTTAAVSLPYVTDYNDVMLVCMMLLDCMFWQLDTSVKQADQRTYCMCRLPANPNATWDLVLIQSPNTTISCPACLLTFTSSAIGRYQQLWQLTQSDKWQELHVGQYQYIYLPDGKVYHAVDQIDRCEWFGFACSCCTQAPLHC